MAGSIWILFLGRILDGVSGASVSVAQAAVGDVSPPSQRARLMGLLGAAFGVGFVAGPAIGALAALGGAKLPFFIAAGIAAVNGLVAIKRLPETAKGVAGHPLADPEVVAARAAEFAAFEAAAAGTAAAATGHDGVIAAGIDAERIAAEPALDGPGIVEPAHLARPLGRGDAEAADDSVDRSAIVRLIIVAFVAMVAFAGFEATFSLLAQSRFGLTLASTSAVFVGIGVVLVAVQGGLVHPVVSRLGERNTLRFGLVANAVGLGLLAVSLGWPGLIVSLLLLTVGQGLLTPTLSSAVSGRAGRQRGQWLGWQQSAGGLARVIGPIVAGSLFEFTGVGAPYVLGAVLALVALALIPSGPAPDRSPRRTRGPDEASGEHGGYREVTWRGRPCTRPDSNPFTSEVTAMSDFSLDLNEDQLHIQEWVHDFAEDVVRPAAARVGRARGDPLAGHPGGRQDRPLRLRVDRRSSGPTRPA